MLPGSSQTAPFNTAFFPQHIALLTVGENLMPMGYWTVISKEPFRLLICMGVGNHSLTLLKTTKEAAFHFMPWSERARVVKAGHISVANVDIKKLIGITIHGTRRLLRYKIAVTKTARPAPKSLTIIAVRLSQRSASTPASGEKIICGA